MAAQKIQAGAAEIVVAGGMESMSQAPFILPQARWGQRMGHVQVLDTMIHDGLWCSFGDTHMGIVLSYLEVIADTIGGLEEPIQKKIKDGVLFSDKAVALEGKDLATAAITGYFGR